MQIQMYHHILGNSEKRTTHIIWQSILSKGGKFGGEKYLPYNLKEHNNTGLGLFLQKATVDIEQ